MKIFDEMYVLCDINILFTNQNIEFSSRNLKNHLKVQKGAYFPKGNKKRKIFSGYDVFLRTGFSHFQQNQQPSASIPQQIQTINPQYLHYIPRNSKI